MKIVHQTLNSVLYVALSGELDESKARQTRDTLDTLFETKKMNKVVMDLSGLSFMDSTGIGVLMGRFKKLKSMSVPLLIANPSKAVDKIMNLSGLYQFMPKVNY
ncbi:MAG: anti-sigma factor antagonist [Firmicutes bacterium]|nr:anti-sigma factor antagonist [Bacillota bacterium]